jgi:hypothetical protein
MELLFIRMMNKQQIVVAIARALPDSHESKNLAYDELLSAWFIGMRSGRGLQLTDQGNKAFTDANIEYADRKISYSLESAGLHSVHFTNRLRQKMPCPYYLHTGIIDGANAPSIRVFDLSVVVWIDLHGGVAEYLKTLASR